MIFEGALWILVVVCYAIVLPGHKSAFRAGFGPDCYREDTEIGPPAGRRPAGGPISVFSWSLGKIRPGRPISSPEALLCNIECSKLQS
jgi:hypothetical protein